MRNRNQRGVFSLLKLQLSIAFIAASGFGIYGGYQSAYSALLGGLICTLSTFLFARKVFAHQGALQAKKIVNAFYKGEATKLILSMGLFSAVFLLVPVTAVTFFTTYILVQTSFWCAPWLFNNKQ